MENRDIILNELREISPLLAGANRGNVYSVDPTYFENLASQIVDGLNSAPESFNFSSVIPYKVSEGYFENFSGTVLQKIKNSQSGRNEVTRELDEIAPLLNTINKATLYTVPNGYFENQQISPLLNRKAGGKVISFSKKMMRYAAAAVVTGVVAVSSYFIIQRNSGTSQPQAVNINSAVKDLKDEEIIEFLETSSVTTTFSEKLAPSHEIKQQLKEVSDDELQQYLKENAEPGEIEVDI